MNSTVPFLRHYQLPDGCRMYGDHLYGHVVKPKPSLLLTVAVIALLGNARSSQAAMSVSELAPNLLDSNAIEKLSKTSVGNSYLDSLHSAASNFRDYECFCHLMTVKGDKWKDFAGAKIFYKQKELIRIEVKSKDYRNGSVVVRESDGKIRGKGGGALSLMTMTLRPDSRTLALPTGFNLVDSNFVSLYNSLRQELAKGSEASVSAPMQIPSFDQPVQVLLLRKKGGGILHVVYLSPSTKMPIAWNTWKDGQSSALVFFDEFRANKGLSDELFRL